MPKAKVNGIELYYEVHGPEGADFLLMIQGLGHDARFWFRQVPELSRHFRLILFDNRGVGRSDKPDEPYSIAGDAADALGLLDVLGVERAHVLGASRGGYIAQEIAISYPERVRKLVLLCTHYGGPEYLELTRDLWKELLDVKGLPPDEIHRRFICYAVTEGFFERERELVEEMVRMRLELPQPAYAFKRQFEAAAAFDVKDRVHLIRAPTLLLAGKEDKIVPLVLMERLAERIPKARLVVVEEAGHFLFIERPEVVNREIVRFLKGEG